MLGARAGKYKSGARAGKHKLGTRAGKCKLGARAGGQTEGRRPGNTNTQRKLHKKLFKKIKESRKHFVNPTTLKHKSNRSLNCLWSKQELYFHVQITININIILPTELYRRWMHLGTNITCKCLLNQRSIKLNREKRSDMEKQHSIVWRHTKYKYI